MSTINLAVKKESGSNFPRFPRGGIIGSFFALALVLCLYGGLLYANRALNAKINDAQAQYADEYKKFLVGNASEVIDFGNRSVVANKLISQSRSSEYFFKQLESSILPSVYLNSLAYDRDGDVLKMNCITDNFNNEAKQLLSFKENSIVSSLSLGESMVDAKTGLVNFTVSLKIK